MDDYKNDKRIIDATTIENQITTKVLGKRIRYFEEIDSTNTVAKKLGKEPDSHGILVLSNSQSAGRGRLGRNWDSPQNAGIWMSLILKPSIKINNASMLTLVAALAVNKGLRNITNLNSFIKWPNDIIINGKKVCGILTEMTTTKDTLESIVVGIGINVSNETFQDGIKDKATSLRQEGYKEVNKLQIIDEILICMEYYYEIFIRTENLGQLCKEYNSSLINIDKTVKIIERGNEWKGTAIGINELGELLVKTDDGAEKESIRAVVSGEVSVRGIYGYV